MITNLDKKCRACGCGLTRREIAKDAWFCRKCHTQGAEEERRGICEDREPGGYDTVTHMRRLQTCDPSLLAADLEAMGITPNGDDPEDYHDEC